MPTIIRFSSSGSAGPPGEGPRHRAQTIALAVTALAAGALLLAFGLVLLAALAAVGVVVGGGVAVYHKLTGRWPGLPRGVSMHVGRVDPALDPTKQVFPPTARQLPSSESGGTRRPGGGSGDGEG